MSSLILLNLETLRYLSGYFGCLKFGDLGGLISVPEITTQRVRIKNGGGTFKEVGHLKMLNMKKDYTNLYMYI